MSRFDFSSLFDDDEDDRKRFDFSSLLDDDEEEDEKKNLFRNVKTGSSSIETKLAEPEFTLAEKALGKLMQPGGPVLGSLVDIPGLGREAQGAIGKSMASRFMDSAAGFVYGAAELAEKAIHTPEGPNKSLLLAPEVYADQGGEKRALLLQGVRNQMRETVEEKVRWAEGQMPNSVARNLMKASDLLADLGGAAVSPGFTAKGAVAGGKMAWKAVGKVAGAGALTGAIYGPLENPEAPVESTAIGALFGGAVGGAIGTAMKKGADKASKKAKAAVDPLGVRQREFVEALLELKGEEGASETLASSGISDEALSRVYEAFPSLKPKLPENAVREGRTIRVEASVPGFESRAAEGVSETAEALPHAGSDVSQEAINRLATGVRFYHVSPGGDIRPVLNDVAAIDVQPPKGWAKIRVTPDGRYTVESGVLRAAGARRLEEPDTKSMFAAAASRKMDTDTSAPIIEIDLSMDDEVAALKELGVKLGDNLPPVKLTTTMVSPQVESTFRQIPGSKEWSVATQRTRLDEAKAVPGRPFRNEKSFIPTRGKRGPLYGSRIADSLVRLWDAGLSMFTQFGMDPTARMRGFQDEVGNRVNPRNIARRYSHAKTASDVEKGTSTRRQEIEELLGGIIENDYNLRAKAGALRDEAEDFGLVIRKELGEIADNIGMKYEEASLALYKAKTTRNWNEIPQELVDFDKRVETKIDGLRQSLLQSGLAKEKADAITYMASSYLHRDYQLWHSPKYGEMRLAQDKSTDPDWQAAIAVKMQQLEDNPQFAKLSPNELRVKAEASLEELIREGAVVEPWRVNGNLPLLIRGKNDVFESRIGTTEEQWQQVFEAARTETRKALDDEGVILPENARPEEYVDWDVYITKFVEENLGKRKGERVKSRYAAMLAERPDLEDPRFEFTPEQMREKEWIFRRALQEEDQPEAFRRLMGEVTDYTYAARNTISEIATDMSVAEFYSKFSAAAHAVGLVSYEPIPGFVNIKSDSFRGLVRTVGKTGEDLAGVWVEEGIANLLQAISTKTAQMGKINRFLNGTADGIKLGMVATPGGVTKNAVGAMWYAFVNGHGVNKVGDLLVDLASTVVGKGEVKGVGTTTKALAYSIGKGGKKGGLLERNLAKWMFEFAPSGEPNDVLKKIYEYRRHGLMQGGVGAEMEESIRRMNESKFAETGVPTKSGALKRAVGLVGRVYQSPDVVAKIEAYETEKKWLSLVMGKPVDETIEKQAAQMVNDAYPSYDHGWPILRSLQRNWFTKNFMSFPLETMRNQGNILLHAKDYADLGLAALKEGRHDAAATAAGIVTLKITGMAVGWGLATHVASTALTQAYGFTKAQLEALKDLTYYEGSRAQDPMILDYDTETGNVSYVDTRSWDPFWLTTTMVSSFARARNMAVEGYIEDTPISRFLNASKFFFEEANSQLVQPGILAKAGTEFLYGKNVRSYTDMAKGGDPSGAYADPNSFKYYPGISELWGTPNEDSAIPEVLNRKLYRLYRNVTPRMVTQPENVLRAEGVIGDNDKGGLQYTTGAEVLRSTTGVVITTKNVFRAASADMRVTTLKLGKIGQDLRKELAALSKDPSSRGNPVKLQEVYAKYDAPFQEAMGELKWKVEKMRMQPMNMFTEKRMRMVLDKSMGKNEFGSQMANLTNYMKTIAINRPWQTPSIREAYSFKIE